MKSWFVLLSAGCASFLVFLLAGIVLKLGWDAREAISTYGWGFIFHSQWNSVKGVFGILPRLYGTIVTSGLALVIALPIGLGTALWLAETNPDSVIRLVVGGAIELLAGIPSVIYGLWGIFVLIPWLTPGFNWLHRHWGALPVFSTPFPGRSLLVAALILSIMILPTIVALTRDLLVGVPLELRLAALSLGATPWETIVNVVLPYTRSGIISTVLLALGRALGETMAVTMVIGNANVLSLSWLAPADTIASLLANNFAEARDREISALMYGALVLLAISLGVNLTAELVLLKPEPPPGVEGKSRQSKVQEKD
ncbi:MAG: phosphate ABC transporter permease subunit PstC [Cyanobacteria bacterium KgW148]|nr:phosphate ABC transporter permease subunit PstC [Cyanobacteria bacterium KgW148]